MATHLRKLKIDELSLVDNPANAGAAVVLIKRHPPTDTIPRPTLTVGDFAKAFVLQGYSAEEAVALAKREYVRDGDGKFATTPGGGRGYDTKPGKMMYNLKTKLRQAEAGGDKSAANAIRRQISQLRDSRGRLEITPDAKPAGNASRFASLQSRAGSIRSTYADFAENHPNGNARRSAKTVASIADQLHGSLTAATRDPGEKFHHRAIRHYSVKLRQAMQNHRNTVASSR